MTTAGPSPRPLLVGVGNRDRGDDAAGPMVVDAVRRTGSAHLDTVIADGNLADLARRWTAEQTVMIVDACRSGRPPGTIRTLDGLTAPLPIGGGPISSHGVGLAEAIELARLLDRLPRSLTVFGIEATSFDHFAPVGRPVAEAVEALAGRILRLAGDLRL